MNDQKKDELQSRVSLNYRFSDQGVKYGEKHPHANQSQNAPHAFQTSFRYRTLPDRIDLSRIVADVYDQENIGSCVANSVAMAYRMTIELYNQKSTFHQYAWYYKKVNPSRLYLYFYNRILEDIPPTQDTGSSILSGYRTIVEHGVVDESYWPYVPKNFSKPPPPRVNLQAEESVSPGYQKIQNNLMSLKHALANKQPVSFGAVLFKSFFDEKVVASGRVPMPRKHAADVCGGHALLLIGYDDQREVFLIKNSWGKYWGVNGVGEMPYKYVTDPELCADFWSFVRL